MTPHGMKMIERARQSEAPQSPVARGFSLGTTVTLSNR